MFLRDLDAWQASDTQVAAVRGNAINALQLLKPKSIDAFVTDPPYGVALELKSRTRRNSIAGDGQYEARRLWDAWVPLACQAAKDDTLHIVFGSWKSPWMLETLQRSFRVSACIAWDKVQNSVYGGYVTPRWELAYVCAKGSPAVMRPRIPDVWTIKRLSVTKHPCEKPIPLLRRAIRVATGGQPAGKLICDPFAGIFSTGVAAVEEGCRFVGVELDRHFWSLGRKRLDAACSPPSA